MNTHKTLWSKKVRTREQYAAENCRIYVINVVIIYEVLPCRFYYFISLEYTF